MLHTFDMPRFLLYFAELYLERLFEDFHVLVCLHGLFSCFRGKPEKCKPAKKYICFTRIFKILIEERKTSQCIVKKRTVIKVF